MRRFSAPVSCLTAAMALLAPHAVCAGETATASVSVAAHFGERMALEVSSEMLRFDVTAGTAEATATVGFSAAARTRRGGEIVLSVEPLGTTGPGGAADVETTLRLRGDGDGIIAGDLEKSSPVPAARWHGSGVRQGSLTFALRAPVAGRYDVPVRFVLSAP